jgi:glycosyltransferase involved in cell wall biosynthesis
MAKKKSGTIFDKVLFIGPDLKGRGGIVSVLQAYRDALPTFHFISTNSRRGLIPGLFNFARTLVALPFIRLFRPYTTLDIHGANGKSWTRKRLIINLGHILGYKIVFHMHGGELRKYVAAKGTEYYMKCFRKCRHVVFLTDAWTKYAQQELGCTNAVTLMNIVPTPTMAKQPRTEGAPISLVYLGYIYKEKGIFDLLDVIASNRDRWLGHLTLTIGGQWNEDRVLNFIKDNDLGGIVKFVGWVSGDDKATILSKTDILILPSYYEGLPISILEAMSYAMPVITTPVGGIPEVVTDGVEGTLFTPGDKAAMTRAIDRYIECPGLIIKQGNAGWEKSKLFSPEHIVNRLSQILE